MAPLLKHNSELLFMTPDKRSCFPPNLTTLEGKRHCWARPGGHACALQNPMSLPQALPALPEPPRCLGNQTNLS